MAAANPSVAGVSGGSRSSSFASELGVDKGSIVAFVGGGGKTSLMYALARQLHSSNLRVLCTTTTKMMAPRVPAVRATRQLPKAFGHAYLIDIHTARVVQDCAAFVLAGEMGLERAQADVAAAMAEPAGGPVLLAGAYDAAMPGNKRVVGIPAAWPAELLAAGDCCDVVLVEVR